MRHKALPLPGQLALDFVVTEVEPGLFETGQQSQAGSAETLGRTVEAPLPAPLRTPADEGRDALS